MAALAAGVPALISYVTQLELIKLRSGFNIPFNQMKGTLQGQKEEAELKRRYCGKD
jgi:hypothetical protein